MKEGFLILSIAIIQQNGYFLAYLTALSLCLHLCHSSRMVAMDIPCVKKVAVFMPVKVVTHNTSRQPEHAQRLWKSWLCWILSLQCAMYARTWWMHLWCKHSVTFSFSHFLSLSLSLSHTCTHLYKKEVYYNK